MPGGGLTYQGVEGGFLGQAIIRNIDLTVNHGSIVLLVGANGSGKSTLMKVTMGAAEIYGGKVSVNGDGLRVRQNRIVSDGRIGYLPQGGGLFLELTVQENFSLVLGESRANSLKRVQSSIEDMFPLVEERWNEQAVLLSGGERQQIAIALAVVKRTSVLLLDEPSIGLSPELVQQVLMKIKAIRDVFGAGVLLVEQRVGEALEVADRVVGLRSGRIVFEGSSGEVKKRKEVLHPVFFGEVDSATYADEG